VLLSLAAALTLAACGGSDDSSGADTQTGMASNSTQTNQSSSTQSNGSTTQTNQSSQSNGGSMSQSSFSTDEGTVHTFAGAADATVTVDVDKPSRLVWSSDKGRRFRVGGTGGADVDSSDGSGELALAAGRHRLQVRGGGVWTIVVRPG
jgi:ABC-type phosphate transport system substrate-binding protein